ncbi:MAG: restriction endonuclease subunit S, partial [Candidatus Caldatribacteriota bacterium]
ETIKWEISGSTIKRLYNNAFIKKVVPVPSIDMQRKIIDVLSATDQKILLNSNLKEKLVLLKKGLMSDLLSGSKRVKI